MIFNLIIIYVYVLILVNDDCTVLLVVFICCDLVSDVFIVDVIVCTSMFIYFQIILIFTAYNMEAPTYGDYKYPNTAIAIGWSIAMISLLPIPSFMLYQILNTDGNMIKVKIIRLELS